MGLFVLCEGMYDGLQAGMEAVRRMHGGRVLDLDHDHEGDTGCPCITIPPRTLSKSLMSLQNPWHHLEAVIGEWVSTD